MTETSLTLYIDLEQGSKVDMEPAAYAAIAWSQLIKEIGQHVDPMNEWEVELESALPGSQKIRGVIKLPSTDKVYGAIVGAILTSLLFALKEGSAWGVGEVLDWIMGPDAPEETQLLSEKERKLIAEDIAKYLKEDIGKKKSNEVFQALEQDESVIGVGVTASATKKPDYMIPRGSFPTINSEIPDEDVEDRVTVEQVELVLVRPILTDDTSRRWGFESQFGNFGAPILDQDFLSKLSQGKLNIPLTQGIKMIVDLEVTERKEHGLWRPAERAIKRVVKILPPATQIDFISDGPQ
tara:strand:- start:563 stop:1447 length:885 start_codon:yes stop_codon:yes gene_type:complete